MLIDNSVSLAYHSLRKYLVCACEHLKLFSRGILEGTMTNFLRKLFGSQSIPQPTNEDIDLTKFYTNSEHELELFEQLMISTNLSKRLLVIHGLGGVGKSTLLKMYALSCRRHQVPVALVSSEETSSPVGVLVGWTDDLSCDEVMLPSVQKM